jgi:hypothetical protein
MAPADAAILLTCLDSTSVVGVTSTEAIIADHLDFDDRRFDHLRAGLMVLDCALNENCSVTTARDVLGMMAGYAKRVDPAAAGAALAATGGASPALREAFEQKVKWAKFEIAQRVRALDPRRKQLWVDIPERVWSERQEYYQRYQKLYAALDPLLDVARGGHDDPAATSEQIRALRGEYLSSCKVAGCLFTPFVLETTRALALLAVRMKDVPTARAEADLLRDDRLTSQYFSRAMLMALLPASEHEAEAWVKFKSAKQSGADQATLDAMFGTTPPIQVSPDAPAVTWGRRDLPDITSALPAEGVISAGGTVRAVDRHGATATVLFSDVVTSYTDDDCHETDKVDGIGRDGRLIYREICRTTATHVEHQKVDPVEVPANDAASLRAGDNAVAWITTTGRKGAIISALREDKIVQIRGHRLRVPESQRFRR